MTAPECSFCGQWIAADDTDQLGEISTTSTGRRRWNVCGSCMRAAAGRVRERVNRGLRT